MIFANICYMILIQNIFVSNNEVDPDACLHAHNAKRALHGAPALMWDDKLAQDAKNWADHLASIGYPVHAQNIDEGENLFSSSSGFVSSCSDAVESW